MDPSFVLHSASTMTTPAQRRAGSTQVRSYATCQHSDCTYDGARNSGSVLTTAITCCSILTVDRLAFIVPPCCRLRVVVSEVAPPNAQTSCTTAAATPSQTLEARYALYADIVTTASFVTRHGPLLTFT